MSSLKISSTDSRTQLCPKLTRPLGFPVHGRAAAGIDGLAKQCDACFTPEAFAEQQRRVDRCGQQRRRDHLGGVVERGKLLGAHLKVKLEAGVARFQHDAVVFDDEFVDAPDLELVVLPPYGDDRVVERLVARSRRHVVQLEIRGGQRGENSGHQNVAAMVARDLADLVDVLGQVLLQLHQALGSQHHRVQVELEIEQRQLRREVGVVQLFEHLERLRSRVEAVVDEKQLLLGADPANAGLDQAFRQEVLQRMDIFEEVVCEVLQLPGAAAGTDVLFTHDLARNSGATRIADPEPLLPRKPRGLKLLLHRLTTAIVSRVPVPRE